MNARLPHLLALALLLPLASCRIVGGKPDMGGVADIFTPAQNDTVYVESKPTGSTAVSSSLPAAAAATEQPMAAATSAPAASHPNGTYTVQAGDTLSRIARTHGTSLNALAAANGLNLQTAIIKPGQQLQIPPAGNPVSLPAGATAISTPRATAKPATVPAAVPASGTHLVCQGETLAAVSRRYGVNLQELLRVNNLTPETARLIRPGTTLTLPTQRK